MRGCGGRLFSGFLSQCRRAGKRGEKRNGGRRGRQEMTAAHSTARVNAMHQTAPHVTGKVSEHDQSQRCESAFRSSWRPGEQREPGTGKWCSCYSASGLSTMRIFGKPINSPRPCRRRKRERESNARGKSLVGTMLPRRKINRIVPGSRSRFAAGASIRRPWTQGVGPRLMPAVPREPRAERRAQPGFLTDRRRVHAPPACRWLPWPWY